MANHGYPNGFDCVWLASDRQRHVAAFVTAGEGPIPVTSLTQGFIPILDVERAVEQLPCVTTARMLVQVPRPDSFIELAERGFFVYDWEDVHRTSAEATHGYEPVAVPERPVLADALPDDLRGVVDGTVLSSVSFRDPGSLDVTQLIECVRAD